MPTPARHDAHDASRVAADEMRRRMEMLEAELLRREMERRAIEDAQRHDSSPGYDPYADSYGGGYNAYGAGYSNDY